MNIINIELKKLTISAPEYPNDCTFIRFSEQEKEITFKQSDFNNDTNGVKTLSDFIDLFALNKQDTPDFKNESFIDLESDIILCIGSDYIRFIDAASLEQCESLYWIVSEIVEDFDLVIGAIFGCICSGREI